MAGLVQHLETVTPSLINRLNWITEDAGIFSGFDITTNSVNNTIIVGHDTSGLIRPAPTGLGTLINEPKQGIGVMPTGASFYTDQNYNFTITTNTSGSTRTDLLCVFFVEKDLKPYIEPTVVILEGISSIADKRYLPIASLSVPANFLVSREIGITRFEYKSMRKAAMTHIANEFLEQNTFNTVLNSEGNLFTETAADFTSAGVLTIDVNKEFHTVGNSLTGTRALKSIVVTNTDNVNTADKFRLFQVQFNLNWCLYNVANIFSDKTYILTPMSIVTFLYDIENDIFWVVGTTTSNTFKVTAPVPTNANKLLVVPALDNLYYIDATTTTEIRGISSPLNGVTKAELENLVGYEFNIVITNASQINTVLISNVTTTGLDNICFTSSVRIYQPCIINCIVSTDGTLIYNTTNGEIFDDVTSSALAGYPSQAIQPSTTNPIKIYRVGLNRYLVCGSLVTNAVFTNTTAVVILLNTAYKPKLNTHSNILTVTNIVGIGSALLSMTANNTAINCTFVGSVTTNSELRIYFEYVRL